jgi:hypothetical protein
MDTETPLQQNDNTTIGKIASAAGIITGITGGVITAGVINIAILSLGTPIFGPEITVLLNLTGGLYASFTSIKTSMNIADNYVTPTVRNILQSSADYLTKSKSAQQDKQLPMIVPDVNNQLPAPKELDHLPMKVSNVASPSISKKEKAAKPVLKQENSKKPPQKPTKTKALKKQKIESKKNSDTKKKDQVPLTRG